jgi:hypothetical protein
VGETARPVIRYEPHSGPSRALSAARTVGAAAAIAFLATGLQTTVCLTNLDRCRDGGHNIGMPQEERALINGVERRLAEKYAALPVDHITTVVQHAYAQFQSSRVRDFIPLLVQRRADEELGELSVLRPDLAAVALADLGATGPFATV